MEIEAIKCFTFDGVCDLLHLFLIENKESVVLVARYSTSPCDLHIAVIQALLTLMNRSQAQERPYLRALTNLILDIITVLARSAAVITPFTLESIFTQMAQLILSPYTQQKYDEASCALRGLLSLCLLSFLSFVIQGNLQSFLIQPITAVLPLLIPSLLEDTGLNHLLGRSSALALLCLLYRSDVGKEVERLVLSRENVLKCLIRVLEYVDVPILSDDVTSRQQRDVYVVTSVHDP